MKTKPLTEQEMKETNGGLTIKRIDPATEAAPSPDQADPTQPMTPDMAGNATQSYMQDTTGM